ncbi:hypothetical protein [Photobacterium galatheae]|uniref:Uncharacterized protein n=1 Tax=Photobacterium galatheae TaxID=1654360 RepID=A0A066RUG9_9GAMM|nr:hypothetical protein [Photobacterium galatheae]KDM91033.1 hypothetical protein EA58_14895 [Photobacterium galatheae]MCM0149015.1 hypothetical protein [Photobacterium galatheae]
MSKEKQPELDKELEQKIAKARVLDSKLASYTDVNKINKNLATIEKDLPSDRKAFIQDLEDKLNQLISNQDKLISTAIKALNRIKKHDIRKKIPDFLAKHGKPLLKVAVATIPLAFIPDAIEVVTAGKNNWDAIKELISIDQLQQLHNDFQHARDTILEHINEENIKEIFAYGMWTGIALEMKHQCSMLFERLFGAYTSGKITTQAGEKIDTAAVLAAYKRIGVDFYQDKINLNDLEKVVAEIKQVAEKVHSLDEIGIINFSRANGIISHDQHTEMLKVQIISGVKDNTYTPQQTELTASVVPILNQVAEALHQTYRYDDNQRRMIALAKPVINNLVFDKEGYEKVDQFMRKCFARDDGGHQNPSNPESTVNLLKEHILSSIASNDQKTMRELANVIQVTQNAIQNLEINNAADAVLAEAVLENETSATNPLEKYDNRANLVKNVGVENIAAIIQSGKSLEQSNNMQKNEKVELSRLKL